MTPVADAITPEVHGALSLAGRHLRTAGYWRATPQRTRRARIAHHEAKAQKLLARAARLSEPRTMLARVFPE